MINFKIWFLNEVAQDLVDKVLKDVKEKDKPFPDIFKDKDRIVIPYSSNETIKVILSKLRAAGTINLDNGTIKFGNRDFRIGKFILQSQKEKSTGKVILKKPSEETEPYFSNDEVDWWNKAGEPLKKLKQTDQSDDDYVVVVSRNPIDILRMSDHDKWSSCHSPSGMYFHCAVSESKNAGGLAYVVKKDDLKKIDLNNIEIFKDKDRKIDGIEPIARLRLRLFKNKEDDHHIAIPEDRVYGLQLDGLQDTIRKWAYDQQKEKLAHRPKLKEYELMGGTYQDTNAAELFNKFFGDDVDKGGADYGGDEAESLEELYTREVEQIKQDYSDSTLFKFDASVENYDNEVYVNYRAYFSMIYPNAELYNNFSYKDRDEIERWGDHHELYGIRDVDMFDSEKGLVVKFELVDTGGRSDPDAFRDFCESLTQTEKNKEEIRNSLYHLLMKLGYVNKSLAYKTIQQEKHEVLNRFKNFELFSDFNKRGHLIEYSLKTKTPIQIYNINTAEDNRNYKVYELLNSNEMAQHKYNLMQAILHGKDSQKAFSPSLEHRLLDVIRSAIFNLNVFPKMDLQKLVYDTIQLTLPLSKNGNFEGINLDIYLNIKSYENDEHINQIIEFLKALDKNYDQLIFSVKKQAHTLLDPYLKTFFKIL